MKPTHVDVVIVGAGAGGGVVAKELAEAGFSVVVLERGRQFVYDPLRDDELVSQRSPSITLGYGPDDERHRRVLGTGAGEPHVVRPSDGGYGAISAAVGGGTLTYGAMAWRFMERDFRLRSTYGEIKGASLADWPMTYAELEPFYTKAEWEIGVSGDDRGNPQAPPRSKPLPMPPFPYNKEGRILESAAKRLGWNPFPIPMARNSAVYDNRPPCIHRRNCVGFMCPANAKGGTQNTVLPKALATGNCELRTQVQVHEIVTDDDGRVRGVRYANEALESITQTAEIVVVSASAVETARLLLNSRSKRHPDGLGNRFDMVGRNLQSHHYTGATGLFKDEVYEDQGPGATIATCDFNHTVDGIFGGGILANEFIRLPALFTGVRPPGAPRWGADHKKFQRDYFKRHMGVKGPVQELPVSDCRVDVDPRVKDAWGMPVARISGQRHQEDLRAANMLAKKAETWLKEAGAFQTWRDHRTTARGAYAGQHQAGTCRMGHDPASSVTDRNGRVHGLDNLFIADGSLLVNNGGFNPSLTIMAVSFWVAAGIRRQFKP